MTAPLRCDLAEGIKGGSGKCANQNMGNTAFQRHQGLPGMVLTIQHTENPGSGKFATKFSQHVCKPLRPHYLPRIEWPVQEKGTIPHDLTGNSRTPKILNLDVGGMGGHGLAGSMLVWDERRKEDYSRARACEAMTNKKGDPKAALENLVSNRIRGTSPW